MTDGELPLHGVRVLDLADGVAAVTTRLLADLGADVVRVEPPEGAPARRREPVVAGTGVAHLVQDANKRSAVVDAADLARLVRSAAILVHDRPPGADDGLTAEELHALNPALVVVAVTPFGQTGPYRDRVATDEVLLAMSGALARSGRPGLPPLPPPAAIAGHSAAVQAAWATLVAYAGALESGVGDLVDVSLHEALTHAVDPGFGISGSATGGARAIGTRDRPDVAHLYPIFPCADGHVRICVLSGGSGAACGAGWASPRSSPIPASSTSGSGSRPGTGCTR
ncbi:hypothetical protein GCM10010472_57970 [Pseudonocardia halophobica]|uniref:CoA transferase family III n=1 Tax=Pseudonocardia halophobica TaxID=29401 RepID=A0A9W6L800_9PSEU|nr:CoA transferase [Pseudonocardia halophobica]GLL12729.1 hypothetical protein GCM10017577_38700 [Pseudonocardia halophobica]